MNLFDWHWIPQHREGDDWEVFRRMTPGFVKVVWEGLPVYVEDVLQVGAGYIYRDYQLSENWHSRDLVSVEQAAVIGAQHAAYLQPAYNLLRSIGVPQDRIWFEGLNEPRVWTQEEAPARVCAYYAAFLKGLHTFGARGVCGCFGVGWPANSGGDTPPNWAPFEAMIAAMNLDPEYPDYLGVHEYWAFNGPLENWGWWAGRVLKCPYDVPILVTECGIDGGVIGQWELGWASLPGDSRDEKAARYCDELWLYMERMGEDPRFQGGFTFTYDGNGDDWADFNIKDDPFLAQLWQQVYDAGIPKADRWVSGEVVPEPEEHVILEACVAMPKNPDKSTEWTLRDKADIVRTVIHHSDTEKLDTQTEMEHLEAIARYHISLGWWTIGYHYCVFDSGNIYRVNPMICITNHVVDFNSTSVGVCMIGKLHEREPTAAQLDSTAWLVAQLGWPPVPHRALNSTICPGTWDWEELQALVDMYLGNETPEPAPCPVEEIEQHLLAMEIAIASIRDLLVAPVVSSSMAVSDVTISPPPSMPNRPKVLFP